MIFFFFSVTEKYAPLLQDWVRNILCSDQFMKTNHICMYKIVDTGNKPPQWMAVYIIKKKKGKKKLFSLFVFTEMFLSFSFSPTFN